MEKIIFEEERIFPADDTKLPEVIGFVEEKLEAHDCPPKLMMQIPLVVEEIFVNVAHYAYRDQDTTPEARTAKLSFGFIEGNTVVLRMEDHGIAFNPLLKADPDITASADERPIGGLGIYLTKKIMDEVVYEYAEGCNVLTMKKGI